MRHSQNDFLHIVLARFLQRQVQHRDERLRTFERESFSSDIFPPHKLLEDRCVGETRVDSTLAFVRKLQAIFGHLHATLEPIANDSAIDVHELSTDAATVRIAETSQDCLDGVAHDVFEHTAIETPFQVVRTQSIDFRAQVGAIGTPKTERIQVRHQMTAHTKLADKVVDAILDLRHPHRFVRLGISDYRRPALRTVGSSRLGSSCRRRRVGRRAIPADDQKLFKVLSPRIRNARRVTHVLDIEIVDIVQAVAVHGTATSRWILSGLGEESAI